MKLRSPFLIRCVAAVAAFVIWCWVSTLRIRITSLDGRRHPADPAQGQFLYAFWHEGLLAPLSTRVSIAMLISQHADGEMIAQICQWLGFGVVRGSTTRGGCAALQNLMRAGQSNTTHLGITPDGPKGPRRILQMGTVWVASATGLPIVLLGIGFASARRARSWDRFALPLPGSTVYGVLSEPVHVPPDLDRAGLERWRLYVQQRLLQVTELAEAKAQNRAANSEIDPLLAIAPPADPLKKSA
ncbi:MAG: lysophospholipid acyltransferase family protein [Planctomycetales bacterium]|nr:lysophospholipid acyltransferase family protein [Planctomycetales bacterium]